jgi:hypothetical protein
VDLHHDITTDAQVKMTSLRGGKAIGNIRARASPYPRLHSMPIDEEEFRRCSSSYTIYFFFIFTLAHRYRDSFPHTYASIFGSCACDLFCNFAVSSRLECAFLPPAQSLNQTRRPTHGFLECSNQVMYRAHCCCYNNTINSLCTEIPRVCCVHLPRWQVVFTVSDFYSCWSIVLVLSVC